MSEKVSSITTDNLIDYCRIDNASETDKTFIAQCLDVAKSYISNYTGIDSDDLDEISDFVIVVYILVQDMYDTRTLYVDKTNINKTAETILNLHSVNLL